MLMGELNENAYTYVTDKRACGVDLFKRALAHAIKTIKVFEKNGRDFAFIAIRCPAEFAENELYLQAVKAILEENKGIDASKLCLEFPNAMIEKGEQGKYAILNAKLLGVKTCMTDCGSENFPAAKLTEISPDYVLLNQDATKWAGDRDKPQLFKSLIAYIKSMGCDVIAHCEQSNLQQMRGSYCFGYTDTSAKPINFTEALNQQEKY